MSVIPLSLQKEWPKMPKSDYASIWVYEKGRIMNQRLIVNFTSVSDSTDALLSLALGFRAMSWLSCSRSMDLMSHLLICASDIMDCSSTTGKGRIHMGLEYANDSSMDTANYML